MRLLTPLALLLVAPPAAQGQQASGLDAGTPIRIRVRAVNGRIEGTLLGVQRDTLVVGRTSDTLHVPLSTLRRADVNFRGGFRFRPAVRGAAIGFGTGLLVTALTISDVHDNPGAYGALMVGTQTLMGFLSQGGGSNARTGSLIGAGVGIPIGIAIATRDYQPCGSGSFLCFGEGFYVMIGALGGAAIGGVTGMLVGAFIPGDHWEKVSKDRLRLTVNAGAEGGIELGAQLRF